MDEDMKSYGLVVEYPGKPNQELDAVIKRIADLGVPDSGFLLQPPTRDLCFYAPSKEAAEEAGKRFKMVVAGLETMANWNSDAIEPSIALALRQIKFEVTEAIED